jgi:SSS family solute:Na+ symporter
MQKPDEVYPILANRYLGPGLKGLVVAGVAAAAVSAFDSMGSALSAIFTRDVYARFLVRNRGDAHYVWVSRIATIGVLALGFAYVPFIATRGSMIRAFTTLIPVFVTPLFTIYVVGALTRAHRRSGIFGLIAGSLYGVLALVDREFHNLTWLPDSLTNRWSALSLSFAVTAAAMALTTMVLGRQSKRETVIPFEEQGWLQRSRETLPPLREHPFASRPPVWLRPAWWAAGLTAVSAWVVFVLFW